MVESEKPASSRTGATSAKTDATTRPRRSLRGWFSVACRAAIALIVIAAAGWGTWRFIGSAATVDDEDSIADLDGFESAAPFPQSRRHSEPSHRRQESGNALAAPHRDDMISLSSGIMNPPPDYESRDSANAWLTGTIEDAESGEKLELPKRLSGGPDDSAILR